MLHPVPTILLVEDDAEDAEMAMYYLSKLNGVHFVHLDDGDCALNYLFDQNNPVPAMVLLDLKMPKVDGIEVLKKLKAHPALKEVPVIALLSGKEGRKYVESFEIKADGYLVKPIDCKNFISVVTEIGLAKIVPARFSNRTSDHT